MEPVCLELPPGPLALPALLRAVHRYASERARPLDPIGGLAEGTVVLHSARRLPGLGRWTLVGVCPTRRVRGQAHSLWLEQWRGGAWHRVAALEEPFEALERLRAPSRAWGAPRGVELPFSGGIMGVLGYGCRASVEALGRDEARHQESDLWWGLYDTFVAHDGESQRTWVLSHGAGQEGRADAERARGRAEALARCLAEVGAAQGAPWPALALSPEWSREAYGRAVEAVLGAIGAGVCYQGCLTYALRGERPQGVSARTLFEALAREQPAPFAALLALGEPVALASASPERFLQVRGGVVRARPMKGTRGRQEDPQEDEATGAALLASEKDRAENLMIVDLMRNDIGRVCQVGSVEVPALFTLERHASVWQLTSTIEGALAPGVSPAALLRACFPPGSMTGAPKVEAMRLLASLEPGPRGWYAGVVGYVDGRGEVDLSVVIRAAQVSRREVAWHVGGGVVADSTAAGEWAESLEKCPALWSLAGPAQ